MNCLDSNIPRNTSFFNLHDSSLGRQVNAVTQKPRNSSVLYHKTKNPFEAKIGMTISFQLP